MQSRYYDPIVKRFLNADSYGSTGQGFIGYNMFAYCGNNPVNVTDPDGHMCIPANINLQMTDTGDHGGGVVGSTGGGGGVIASLWLFALIYEFFALSRDPFPDTWNQDANAQASNSSQSAQPKAIAGSTPASPPDPNGDKHSYNEIGKNSRANKIAQEFGYEDAESFKDAIVGRHNGGRFNMAIDTVTKEIVLIKIQGGIIVPTGYFLEILIN